MIQTYNPDHYAIRFGAKQDYETFFRYEMNQRKIAQYPPYTYLVLLEFNSKNETKAIEASYDFKKELEMQEIESLSTIGPIVPYYSLNNGKYKRILLLKFKKQEEVLQYLKAALPRFNGLSGVDITVNVDPLDY